MLDRSIRQRALEPANIQVANGRIQNIGTHLFGNHILLNRNFTQYLTRWHKFLLSNMIRFEIFKAV